MPILSLLPALLLYFLGRRFTDAMSAFVCAAIVWGALLLAGTELLSLDHMLTPTALATGWALTTLVLAGLLLHSRRTASVSPAPAPVPPWWALLPALSILLVTLIIGLVAPPNSTDALTYYLVRVAFWVQDRSVQVYATTVTRQFFMPPWAEYLILHLQILAGGSDRFAPLVEWLAFAGCLVVGAGIARRLGANARGVGLAIVLMVTLPTAVVEANSTQTDLVVAFWSVVIAGSPCRSRGEACCATPFSRVRRWVWPSRARARPT